jgi:hypothetical protein
VVKTETNDARKFCGECGVREWCAVTLRTGVRRCFLCWVAHYLEVR